MRRFRTRLLTVGLAAAALAVLPSYLWAYKLTGASAAPNALVHDTILVNRAAYDVRIPYGHQQLLRVGAPKRGEVVQVRLPQGHGVGPKRVIGLPGETIEIRENRVFVNGAPLPVETVAGAFDQVPPDHRMGSSVVSEDGHLVAYTPGAGEYRNCPARRLGAGEYFVLGDNRDNSLDSRSFGPVPRDAILGKVVAVFATGERVKR